jgi:hypothetical protein
MQAADSSPQTATSRRGPTYLTSTERDRINSRITVNLYLRFAERLGVVQTNVRSRRQNGCGIACAHKRASSEVVQRGKKTPASQTMCIAEKNLCTSAEPRILAVGSRSSMPSLRNPSLLLPCPALRPSRPIVMHSANHGEEYMPESVSSPQNQYHLRNTYVQTYQIFRDNRQHWFQTLGILKSVSCVKTVVNGVRGSWR